ncbi:glycoside hydrolase family 66 protein [Bacillaceae bacterium S4-13-58]
MNIEVYPDKGQYRPSEEGNVCVEISSAAKGKAVLHAAFYKMHNLVFEKNYEIMLDGRNRFFTVPFQTDSCKWECYGVEVNVTLSDGKKLIASTAFDVADHWKRAPRYGFLSDFDKEEIGKLEDVEALNKFHINIVQFYDWMYRHDELVPKEDLFIDPMGRELSYKVVKEKVDAVHDKGMAAIAYGAVYASLKDYHERHKHLGLYKRTGDPFHLINTFYIMDISPNSEWNETIVSEFQKVIEEGFDGIHMDQYGFPKKAVRQNGEDKSLVDLQHCYPALINQTEKAVKEVDKQAGLIFNNVSNYPVHTTAKANQDVVYIEVWPPVIHYRELKQLIDRGRELSENKHVILSAYLPPFHKEYENYNVEHAENGALMTMATIFASGGYHLLLGEHYKALTTAYYPDYGELRQSFIQEVSQYYDFIVRYGPLLYDHDLLDVSMTYTGGVNTEVQWESDHPVVPNGDLNTIWSIVKQHPDYLIIHLINLIELENDYWEHSKENRPETQADISCSILMERPIKAIYLTSPDHTSIMPKELNFEVVNHEQGEAAKFWIPELKIWDMIYVEWE